MLAGIFVSIIFWSRLAKRDSRLVFIYLAALAGAFLGAKLVYVGAEGWLHWHDKDRWLQIATGKSILGGLLGGYASVEIAKRLLSYHSATGDWFALIAPVALMLGRLGCVLHGCCLGRTCDPSWFTTVDGARIHYQEAGDEEAPPILLIHGFISSTLIWDEVFLPLAAAGFRVIAPDLPGYGYSDKPRHAEYTIESQARAVVGLMDRLGIEKAALVGASYGGAIAAAIALDHPERVSHLVLIGAVSSDEPRKKLLLRMVRLPLVGAPFLPQLARKYPWGLRWIGPLALYTNCGIGTIRVPIRLNCPPEVTMITLRAAPNSRGEARRSNSSM